jgi:peptidoglycan/xylan/chitin deacetylase (PgdA/CDA1 family)
VLWSADSGDCELKEGQSLAAQVAQMPFVDGDIVLMHDDYEHTARDMPEIIADLRRRGYDLVRCCDL